MQLFKEKYKENHKRIPRKVKKHFKKKGYDFKYFNFKNTLRKWIPLFIHIAGAVYVYLKAKKEEQTIT